MTEETTSEILGYTKEGKPIHPTPKGTLTTAACIMCERCGCAIKGMGGPEYGATCVPCYGIRNQKLIPVCNRCGCSDIVADAAARWDVESQKWEISDVYEKGHYCEECNGETRIDFIILDPK